MNSQLLIVLIACAALLLLGGCFMLLAVGVFLFLRAGTEAPVEFQEQGAFPSAVPTPVITPPPPPPLPMALGQAFPEVEDEGAKTEVFQRGSLPMDWDDDDEGEATEVFRADLHGNLGGDDYEMD